MTDRSGIFAGDDPFVIAQSWLAQAVESEPNDPNAVSLATVDENGAPSVRIVLVKEITADAFVFFTNYRSRKGSEIAGNDQVALTFHWKSLRRQIRICGRVVKETSENSDAYYKSRALGSRIGAWASRQSEPLTKKSTLVADVAKAQAKQGLNPKRPDHWGGYRVLPTEIEFWADGKFRLHDRFRWTKPDQGTSWLIQRLYP